MKKSTHEWKTFNFESDSNNQQIIKNKDPAVINIKSNTSKTYMDFNFFKKVEPHVVEDLAIHRKKVKEVELWLQENVKCLSKKQSSIILLLTGPTGSGKTVTVKVLCKELDIKILEWINPIDEDEFISQQTNKFLDFFALGKYSSLCDSCESKQVLLIEDFPNFVTVNPAEFTCILEKCYNGTVPVIFICTDASSNKLDLAQSLFTQDIREKFQITNIHFNPCSVTVLKFALKRVHNLIAAQSNIFQPPPPDIINAIVSSCMGDIRCAINQYYFACIKGVVEIPLTSNCSKKPSAKRKRKEQQSCSIKFMLKDDVLQFFHSIGRVLNPKRIEKGSSWRLQCDFNALITQFSSQPFHFTALLQENYLKYFGDLNDVQKASHILSTAQCFLNKWIECDEIMLYSLWLSVLGLMIHNEHKVSKWNQIKAPTKTKLMIEPNLTTTNLAKTDFLYYNIITANETFYTFK